ncbi:MAG: hypothetical protein ACI8ZB_000386 [Desulforhopalus sp.]|jgi:hypothetical protein
MFSLRKLVWIVFPVTILLLGAVIVLGAWQYTVSGKYGAIINENERALFHFATIRESLTEALITENDLQLTSLLPDMEELHSSFTRMQENPYVPAELKLSLIDNIDIGGVVIRMREIDSQGDNEAQKKTIQKEMRSIGTHLLKYDRVLATLARSRTSSLQLIIIGSLGIVVSIMSLSLILLYRSSIIPMLFLTEQLQRHEGPYEDLQLPGPTSIEILELVEAVRNRTHQENDYGMFLGDKINPDHYSLLAEIINESTNQLNGLINYTQLLVDTENQIYSAQQHELLDKILKTGTEIARSWKKLQ